MARIPYGSSTVLTQYFADIRDIPLLTQEEEQLLTRDIEERREEVMARLVESNLRLVAKIASEYRTLGLPFEDLLNAGNLGLIEAARRFDPSRGTRFISYAIYWIRKAIFDALASQSRVVRLPYSYVKKLKELRSTEALLERDFGRAPTKQEVAQRLDRRVEDIDQLYRFQSHEVSLDEVCSDDRQSTFADTLVDADWVSPEDDEIAKQLTEGVGEAFLRLNDQERAVIAWRFGLAGEPPLTLQQTGERMDLSRERVRQIESRAKERLRRLMIARQRIQAGAKRSYGATAAARSGRSRSRRSVA
jgi:RNA polymerase primary sigma factor